MSETKHCVVFSLDNRFFALPLTEVERIARAAAITPLPSAVDHLLGVINLQGRILPVVDIRKRFSLEGKEISTEDHFIVGKSHDKPIAILVDNVHDIIEVPEENFISRKTIISELPYISGVIKQNEKMILVHELESLLSPDEIENIEKIITELESSKPVKQKPKSGPKPKSSSRKK